MERGGEGGMRGEEKKHVMSVKGGIRLNEALL